MNLSARKSSIHHHLTRPVTKKAGSLRQTPSASHGQAPKVESGFGELHVGTDALNVPAAYKPIFRL